MMSRTQIRNKIKSKEERIKKLKQEITELTKQDILFSDKKQWYTEEIKTIRIKENGKFKNIKILVGYVNWKEKFLDEDTGKYFTIKRCNKVKENNNWIVNF